MVEPEKPFACTMPDCGMTFTNEDHLHVHTKKHDMVLQFGMEQKAAFVADQTPTPTRFIRNCEEVGLFQDLQSVNPFDEGFKRAMECKQGILSLESGIPPPSPCDELHTPQMVFPLDPGDSVYSTNIQRNITISRSSSDESGAIKEFETTTISKLTNEVTTISRVVEKHDELNKSDEKITNNSVSYTNNVIKIQSNVEITKNIEKTDEKVTLYETIPPVMSQKSIDFVVDSLTSDFDKQKKEEIEIIKLPSGQQIKLTDPDRKKSKDILKKMLTEKVESKSTTIPVLNVPGGTLNVPGGTLNVPGGTLNVPGSTLNVPGGTLPGGTLNIPAGTLNVPGGTLNVPGGTLNVPGGTLNVPGGTLNVPAGTLNVPGGTLIPVSIINANIIPKLPLKFDKKPVKRKPEEGSFKIENRHILKDDRQSLLDSRCAASRRYRQRLKETWSKQSDELRKLKEMNDRLVAEKALLKTIIIQHMKNCPNAEDLRNIQDKLKHASTFQEWSAKS